MPYYFDSSAIVKLVRTEAETVALRSWLRSGERVMTSDLARTEVARTVRRHASAAAAQAEAVLATFDIFGLGTPEYLQAGMLPPPELRSLDALHLAAAMTLRPELDGLVTYDDRLADAAARLGVQVLSPGRSPA
ncbi:MAG: type II toxin-antitoxin system VapC family toxin [Bifidobacteriaceae bacterium]|jgi:predicted nucleic acid-binding protein|nr:type II toxin-antitoxin system VapC family toxin [Bifidobacteriaceae bacterium]